MGSKTKLIIDGFACTEFTVTPSVAIYDLQLQGHKENDKITFDWIYDAGLYERSAIERLATVFNTFIRQVVSDASQVLAELGALERFSPA